MSAMSSPVRGFVESSIGLEAKLLNTDASNISNDDNSDIATTTTITTT